MRCTAYLGGRAKTPIMDALWNTSQTLCTRCQRAPRVPGQRWCRACLTAAQRQRRAAQRAAQATDVAPVTQACAQEIPRVTQAGEHAPQPVTHPALPTAPKPIPDLAELARLTQQLLRQVQQYHPIAQKEKSA